MSVAHAAVHAVLGRAAQLHECTEVTGAALAGTVHREFHSKVHCKGKVDPRDGLAAEPQLFLSKRSPMI